MFETVKLNILIHLKYSRENIHEEEISQSDSIIESNNLNTEEKNSIEWFKKCFREKKIESNYQMANSALLVDDNYKFGRIEFSSDKRTSVGLCHNENVLYKLYGTNISFSLGKVRVLFTQSKIAFLHVQIISDRLDEESTRKLIYSFSRINSKQPLISYQKKKSITEVEEVVISLKEIIMNIVNIQSYISFSLYENIINPYFQISIIGTCDNENKYKFFDSIQALSKRQSSRNIDESHVYIGKEDYISRFVGDKCMCIFGDTDECGKSDLVFLTDKKNGLIKTATENYTTVYAFLISLHLLVNKQDLTSNELNYLKNAPFRMSDEENIREFFNHCIIENGWKLKEKIDSLKEKSLIEQIPEKINKGISELKVAHEKNTNKIIWEEKKNNYQMTELYNEVKDISKEIEKIDSKVSYLVDYIKNELSVYLKEQKRLFAQSVDSKKDAGVAKFIEDTSSYISKNIILNGDEIVNRERDGLASLFGDKWNYLLPISQTSLISASTMLKKCSDIHEDFDFSGVCICVTAALETELKRIFFDGLINYMKTEYGEPGKVNADEIYENWPEVLLSIPKYQYIKGQNDDLEIKSVFTMGNLPYLFGVSGKLSKKKNIRSNQLVQSALAHKCMSEYLSTIVNDEYKDNAIDVFLASESSSDGVFYKNGCFVHECEKIRKDFRNKAAHISVMSENQALACYQSVVTKLDTYKYNADIVGTLMELFYKINGVKLNSIFQNSKYTGEVTKYDSLENFDRFSVGQVVEMTNIEVSFNGGLRGIIYDSGMGVSLSKKHLLEKCLVANDYVGKVVKVKLIRWDANARKYNAEWIGIE